MADVEQLPIIPGAVQDRGLHRSQRRAMRKEKWGERREGETREREQRTWKRENAVFYRGLHRRDVRPHHRSTTLVLPVPYHGRSTAHLHRSHVGPPPRLERQQVAR